MNSEHDPNYARLVKSDLISNVSTFDERISRLRRSDAV